VTAAVGDSCHSTSRWWTRRRRCTDRSGCSPPRPRTCAGSDRTTIRWGSCCHNSNLRHCSRRRSRRNYGPPEGAQVADALSGTQASTGPASGTTETSSCRLSAAAACAAGIASAVVATATGVANSRDICRRAGSAQHHQGREESTQATRTDVDAVVSCFPPKARQNIPVVFVYRSRLVGARCSRIFSQSVRSLAQCYPRLARGRVFRRRQRRAALGGRLKSCLGVHPARNRPHPAPDDYVDILTPAPLLERRGEPEASIAAPPSSDAPLRPGEGRG